VGDQAGIAGQDLTGKVAVADRGSVRFGDKLDNVRAAGAAALVVVNNAPGSFSGVLGKIVEIPAVGVRQDAGDRVRDAARAGLALTVTVPAGTGGQGANVIARPRPEARCDILVGGHYDTVPAAPGANDNASGTANVIELARAFAAAGPRDGLCFAAFSGEESGLHGSRALAERLQSDGALPRYMVNLDVTGGGTGIEVIGSPEPSRVALDAAGRLNIPAGATRLPENFGSDHQSFERLGVPVVYLSSGDFSAMHTPDDTADRIDPATLDRIGDLAFATIEALQR
jgi:Zn-dependent M28 family amino/carboxypeptidase